MAQQRLSDAITVLKSLQRVAKSAADLQSHRADVFWQNSSLRQLVDAAGDQVEQRMSDAVVKQAIVQENIERWRSSVNLPPVTETDLEELSQDIDNLGITSKTDTAYAEAQRLAEAKTRAHTKLPPVTEQDLEELSRGIIIPEVSRNQTAQGKVNTTDNQSGVQSAQALPVSTLNQQSRYLKANPMIEHTLSSKSREKKVPANRLSRLVSFGSLAAGLGMGALAEVTRRGIGISGLKDGDGMALLSSSPFMSDANLERIVATLCRVRGAALKLGQGLSIQDNSMINPQLQAVFERVRQSADFMPKAQMNGVLTTEFGSDWRNRFASFEDKPFAAASIGQVHKAILHDGTQVAVKVQYPGVAKSIDSDINNLLTILKVWQILPKGMYAENVMEVSRHELAWECDYEREAKCMELFRELLKDDHVFRVPKVYKDLSTKQVLTTELIPGKPLDACGNLSQEVRDELGSNLLRLCVTELYEWNIMQTDPNWSNFFYDEETRKMYLLDFGATRQYSRKFVDLYIQVIKAAARGDEETVLKVSREMGFLTSYETKVMEEAHVEAVMILGRPCGTGGLYDFGIQKITGDVESIIPIMLKHRLGPPPEETYSLHRKMAGSFLLCSKLKSRVDVKQIYDNVFTSYKPGLPDKDYGV